MEAEDYQRIRNELGLSQAELARVLEVKNPVTISHWETGFRSPDPMKKKIYRILDAMDSTQKTEMIELLLKEGV